jgi:hypothetical protein
MRAPHDLVKYCRFLFALAALGTSCPLPNPAQAQNFLQPKVIATPAGWPVAVYAADMNRDGIQDLIYIDYGATATASTTHVLLGDGKGGFTQIGTAGTFGASIALGNFAGNGGVQFASVFATGPTAPPQIPVCPVSAMQVLVTLTDAAGVPSGTVQGTVCASGTRLPVIGNPIAVELHDGKGADLLFTDSANNLLYLVTLNGSGTTLGIPVATSFALPDGAGPIAAADLNGDGHLDVVVNGQTGFAANVFLGDGNGGLIAKARVAGSSGVHSLAVRDVNGDGRPDLIAEGANGRIDVYAGNGDGSFATTSSGGTGALNGLTGNGGHLIAVADVNHDGLPDALTVTPAGVSALLGSATSYLGLKGIYNAGPGHTSYAVEDFNGDGHLDVAVDSPEGIAILFGNADGSFQTSQAFAAGQPAMSGTLGVFTASGNLDAVVSTAATQAQLLTGKGDGTFSAAAAPTSTTTGPAGLWSRVLAADFNNDGIPDLVLTADGPAATLPQSGVGASIQFGDGKGGFSAPQPLVPSETSACSGSPGYFYGTSMLGVNLLGNSILNRDFSGAHFRFNGTSPFPTGGSNNPEADGTRTCGPFAHDIVATGVFTHPGVSDVFVQADGHLFLLNPEEGGVYSSIPRGDLSVDGSLTTAGQLTAPQLSSTFNGPAIATSAGGLGFPAFIGSAVVADLDKDGNNDLIVTYANLSANLQAPTSAAPNFIYIWYGSGGGKFLTSAKHPTNPVRLTPSRNFYQATVADVNGDGIPDLILSDGYILSVQPGNGDGTFGAETHYLAGQGINAISVGDVNGDGKPDLILANGGAVLSNPVANLESLGVNPDVNTGGITVLLNRAAPALSQATGTVVASPEPSLYGSPFAITVTLAGQGSATAPTGSVNISVDGNPAGTASLSNGQAVLVVPANISATLAVGTHSLSATYAGDSNYGATTLTGTHAVAQIPTSLSLLLCVDPPGSNFPCGSPISTTPLVSPIVMYFGQTVDGVVIESSTGLTGTITFLNGTTVFCTLNANLQAGTNTCPPQSGFFPAGTETVTVVYSGDATHTAATSNGIVVTVQQDPTTTTVASSLNPSTFGQAVTFTASVQGNFSQGIGKAIFLDGTTTLASVTLDSTGSATLTTSTLAVGTHSIRVAFPGSANFASSTSPTLSQVVLPALASVQSVVSLSSSVNPSAPGQPVTFTATVTAPGPFSITPTGTVTFLDGTSTVGTSTLNAAGVATFVTSTLASGSHAITAAYAGTTGSTGVGPVPPPNPPKPPSPHLLPAAPFGMGLRVIGPTPHATVAQRPNPAFLLPASPAPVAEAVKPSPLATAPTPSILAGTSPVLTQVVTSAITAEAPGFVVTVTPAPVSLDLGGTAVLLVNVRDASGFSQPVQLSCAGLPNEATCSFVQTTIPSGGGSTTLQVHVTAPHDCGSNQPYYVASTGSGAGTMAAFALPGLLGGGLLLIGGRRRRLGLTILLLSASLIGLSAVSGCGRCTDLGTEPGTYTFNVVGTAQGGPLTQTQMDSVQLTVTIPKD